LGVARLAAEGDAKTRTELAKALDLYGAIGRASATTKGKKKALTPPPYENFA